MNPTEAGREFLAHYGVKGMRWGVRRTDAQLERAAAKREGDDGESKSEGAGSNSPNKNSRGNTKSLADLNDKELRDVVNRMNMEQQYAKLQPTPASKRAAAFVGKAAANAANQVLTEVLKAQMQPLANQLQTKSKKSS